MYREKDRSSMGGELTRNDGWQDWPPEPSSASGSSQPLEAPAVRGDRSGVSRYLESAPGAPRSRSELPAPLGREAPANDAKPRARTARAIALVLGGLLALGVAGWYGQYWWTTGRYLVSTDDAYVGAKNATLAAKIMGYVADVAVDDNAHVREGDVIAHIDDGDYQLAVKTARDNIATQQATVDRIGKQVAAQDAAVDQAKAQLASAQAGATRSDLVSAAAVRANGPRRREPGSCLP